MEQDRIKRILRSMHDFLMLNKIPYNSVSVVYDHEFRVVFAENAKDMVNDEIKSKIEKAGFKLIFV